MCNTEVTWTIVKGSDRDRPNAHDTFELLDLTLLDLPLNVSFKCVNTVSSFYCIYFRHLEFCVFFLMSFPNSLTPAGI